MFLFQLVVSKGQAVSTKQLAEMESDFLKLNVFNAQASASYFAALKEFSAAHTDAKSQAFCMQAAISLSIWSERMATVSVAVEDKASAASFSTVAKDAKAMYGQMAATPGITSHLDHYQNFFAVAEASRKENGELSLSENPIRKLAGIMDEAHASREAASKSSGTAENETHYFVFANQRNAEEFKDNVLGSASLPVEFDASVGTASDKLGADYVQKKSISSGAYVVEFTCAYTGVSTVQATKPKVKMDIKSTADKRSSLTWKYTSPQKDLSEADVIAYAKEGEMELVGSGKGDLQLSGLAELWYGKGYKIDPIKDAAAAKELVTYAFRELMAKYSIVLQEPLDQFLASEQGQVFIKQLNATKPQVNGSASVEVFYDGSNYGALSAAIKENWKLASDRANLVYDYINKINKTLVKGGLAAIDMPAPKPSLYFFQDLPSDIMDKLVADKNLPTELRSYLKANRDNLKGKEHMEALISYLQSNNGRDGGVAYQKVSDAYGTDATPNYARMNTLWQQTKNNKGGLRVEERDSQSLLVDAIEDSGEGNSRSASISTSVSTAFGIEMGEVGDKIAVDKDGKADIAVPITASSSVKGIAPCINAYLVDIGKGTAVPIENVNDKGEYAVNGLAPGEYAIVAYAQSDDGKVKTTMVGQKFEVETKKNETILDFPQAFGTQMTPIKNDYNRVPFYIVNNVEKSGKKYTEKVDARVAFISMDEYGGGLGFLAPGQNIVKKERCYSAGDKEIAIVRGITLNGVNYTKKGLVSMLDKKAVGIMVGTNVIALDGTTALGMQDDWNTADGVVYAPKIKQNTKKVVHHEGFDSGKQFGAPHIYDKNFIPYYVILPESNVSFGKDGGTLSPRQISQLASQGYTALVRMDGVAKVFSLTGEMLGLYGDVKDEVPKIKGVFAFVSKDDQIPLKKIPDGYPGLDLKYWFNYPQKVYCPADAHYLSGIINAVTSFNAEEVK